jgi:uncharacterized protein (DUF305 family)
MPVSASDRTVAIEEGIMSLRRPMHLFIGLLLAGAASAHAVDAGEKAFLSETMVAMDKMMADMSTRPTGDIDEDFAAAMVPHHQGAIDMAQAELRYGHNEQLRRIAQGIVVEQQQEIVAMQLALVERIRSAE